MKKWNFENLVPKQMGTNGILDIWYQIKLGLNQFDHLVLNKILKNVFRITELNNQDDFNVHMLTLGAVFSS